MTDIFLRNATSIRFFSFRGIDSIRYNVTNGFSRDLSCGIHPPLIVPKGIREKESHGQAARPGGHERRLYFQSTLLSCFIQCLSDMCRSVCQNWVTFLAIRNHITRTLLKQHFVIGSCTTKDYHNKLSRF